MTSAEIRKAFLDSYQNFSSIQTVKLNHKELSSLVKFVDLSHIQTFKQILKEDFGNSMIYFKNRMHFSCKVANSINSNYSARIEGRLFASFKIKA